MQTACQAPIRFPQFEHINQCCPGFRATQLRGGTCAGSMNNLVSMELEGNQLEGTLPAGRLPAHVTALHMLLMIPGFERSDVPALCCHCKLPSCS